MAANLCCAMNLNDFNDLDDRTNYVDELLFQNDASICDEYFTTENFNFSYADNLMNDLKIIHLNIRSLPRNGENFSAYLATLKQKFDIICISETWLNENRFIENIFEDYNQFHSMRPANQPPGGGVAIFVHNRFNCSKIDNLSSNNLNIECVFVEIKHLNSRFIVACCYRKPDPTNAHEFLNQLVDKISCFRRNHNLIVAADFNFDLLQSEHNANSSLFLDTMYSLGLINTISKPTHNISHSLIDNIFISNSIHFSSGIFYWQISDHYPIFVFLKNVLSMGSQSEKIQYRLMTENSIEDFCSSLSTHDFSHILHASDLDIAMQLLDDVIMHFYNMHCPIKTKTITKRDREKPWIDGEIKSLINTRNHYYYLSQNQQMSDDEYKIFRNYVTRRIRDSKRTYFESLLQNAKNDMKKTWDIINGMIKPDYNRKNNVIKSFTIGGEIISDDIRISDILNQHFATVGSRISEEFEDIEHFIHSDRTFPNSMFLSPVLTGDILMIIENMRNKPTNVNTYPIKIIKNARHILSPILAHLINNSLSKGCFPNSLKRARVVPLHKGGDRDDINNYRPISILPLFSKIFERIMYNQLYNFLEKYEILNPDQFGFRKNRSTIEAVLNQLEYIYTNLDQKKTVISIFLDFKKAFDCIDHKILLRKLFFLWN